jgi:hypothetical protein
MRKKESESGNNTHSDSIDRVLNSTGRGLDRTVKTDMEQGFGQDLSAVRIHTGVDAANSASEINARAYTKGNQIVFGQNEYAPHSASGKHLLAHEITHVVQQQKGISTKSNNNSNQDSLEKEADRVADSIVRGAGAKIPIHLQSTVSIRRQVLNSEITDDSEDFEESKIARLILRA